MHWVNNNLIDDKNENLVGCNEAVIVGIRPKSAFMTTTIMT